MTLGYLPFVFLVFPLSSVVLAQENLTCLVIDECRSDDGTCETGDKMSFQITVSADKQTAQIVTPEVDTVLDLASTEDSVTVFEGTMSGNAVHLSLDTGGNFNGVRTSGSGVEFRLRATCRKASG
jgi:hypothetical protein